MVAVSVSVGANKYIQQDSTVWRRDLGTRRWKVESRLRAERDFELRTRFFHYAKVYWVVALIGGYWLHRNALSGSDLQWHEDLR